MHSFSEAEMTELAQYPREAIEHANRMMTKMLHKGEEVKSPFRWFVVVCNNWVAKNKRPETRQEPATRPSTGPRSIYKAPERVEQTDYEWSLAVEPKLHEFTLSGHPGLWITRSYTDRHWNRLTPEQQVYLMETVHVGCMCRATCDKNSHLEGRDKTVRTDNKMFMSKQPSNIDKLSTLDNISQPLDILNEELYEEIY